jgi:Leucine-rich repeat (LRR) protein
MYILLTRTREYISLKKENKTMDKEEQRIQVIAEGNDSANTVFRQSLEKKKKNAKEITVREKLTGNLNLAILQENGFSQVEVLRFKEGGQITSITNIPTTVKRLYLSNQLIENLDLPDGIEYVDIDHNLLSKEWDLSRYQVLKHVNVSYNQVTGFGNNLPESLEKLYCTHNNIRDIFLATCPRIKTLHCNFNADKLRIYDLPDTVVDGQFPEKVFYLSSSKEEGKENRKKSSDSKNKNIDTDIIKIIYY